jgi:hypothetical protein
VRCARAAASSVSIRGRNASRVAANLVRPADTGRGLRVAPSNPPTPTYNDKARAEGAASRGQSPNRIQLKVVVF